MKSLLLVVMLGIGCFAGSGMAWGQAKTHTDFVGGGWNACRWTGPVKDMPAHAPEGCEPLPKPEPMDVPAINEMVYRDKVVLKQIGSKWTCADKSRVMLTSEDGKRHCIKFPEAK